MAQPKPPSLSDLLREDMSPAARGKSLATLQAEDLTEEDAAEKFADDYLKEQSEAADAALEAERAQVAFNKSRTPGGDTARALSITGSAPAPATTKPAPRMVGTSPGTKAAAGALQALTEQPETAASPVRAREGLSPDEAVIQEEAGLAFDIAFKAIEQESDVVWAPGAYTTPEMKAISAGGYKGSTTDPSGGMLGGPISRAYNGLDDRLSAVSDLAKKERIQARVRDILEKEGGVEFWQGTDAEDRESYIDVEILKNMRVGPNAERVEQIRSVIDNATDIQFDASATYGKLEAAYMRDLERGYRAENPEAEGKRLPEEAFAELKAVAANKARQDIQRIKSVTMPHVFIDTKAQDIKAEYLAEGESSALMALKGRTLDPLSVRPSLIDQAYADSTGAGAALPGLMIGATFLGRALEVMSAQEQGAMQFEIFADNLNDAVEKAADPNAPTLAEVASGALRGLGQATITAQVGGPFRTEAYAGLFADDGQTPDDFIREADARMIDIATDNRDYFDSVAFTLPVLLSAPFGRDAQAEALTMSLDHHLAAKFGALVSAVVLPDSSPLGATAQATRKVVSWAAKGRRFAQTTADLGKVAAAVDSAATPEEFIGAAKNVNLAVGQAVEAALIREEVRELVGGVKSTLAGLGETASEATKKAKLGQEVEEAQKVLASLRASKASSDVIRGQVAEIERLIKERLSEVGSDVGQTAFEIRTVEDALERAAKRSDDDLVDEAAEDVVAKAGAGVDAAKVRQEAAKILEEDRVKGILEEHPRHMKALEDGAKIGATPEEVVDAEAAMKALAASIKERGDALGRYADTLDTAADGTLARAASKAGDDAGVEGDVAQGRDALRALESLRKTADEIAAWKGRSPEAAEYLEAQVEAVQAGARTATALAEVDRLKMRSRLVDPQTAAKEQADLLTDLTEAQSKASLAQSAAGNVSADEAIAWERSKNALQSLRKLSPEDVEYPKAQAEYLEAQAEALQASAKAEAAAAEVAQAEVPVDVRRAKKALAVAEEADRLAREALIKEWNAGGASLSRQVRDRALQTEDDVQAARDEVLRVMQTGIPTQTAAETAAWGRAKGALENLRKMSPEDGGYPKAQSEYLEAQAKALQASEDAANAPVPVEKAAREAARQENLARLAALKAATPEGDKVRVLDVGLFRAQEAAAVAQAAETAAHGRARTARAKLPQADRAEVVALSAKAVKALQATSGKGDITDAIDVLQTRAQRAMLGVNSARSMQAGARALRAAHDRATRREVVALTRFLRMRSEKLIDADSMKIAKEVLAAVKYTSDEAGEIKKVLLSTDAPSITALLGKLGKDVRTKRALNQAVEWRTSARKIVNTMRQATTKLSKRDDVSWADLGWRSGEIQKVTVARSAAGNAVDRALRNLPENSPGTIQATEALRVTLGMDTATPNLDALANKIAMSMEDLVVNPRTVQTAAQQDIDLAVQKIMSADETVALAAMQSAWTEKSFRYQMKMFLDPMSSYIGTSSQALRNVYRGVVGTTQMYFSGLNGAVRNATVEIRAKVGESGVALPPKEVFGILMKNIDTFIGAANTVSDRGAAVAHVSIFERAKRALITDAPAQKDGGAVVDAVSGVDRDLLQAQRDAAVAFPGGMTAAQVEKAKTQKANALAQAEKGLEDLRTKEALLSAQVAKLSAPDPKAVEAPDIVSMQEALEALADQQKAAKESVDSLKAADPLDFYDESPLGKRVGEMDAAKGDIAILSEDLQRAKGEISALEKVIKGERAARDAINAKTLGATKVREVPDDENLALSKKLRERLAKTSKKEAEALDALEGVEDAARDKAYNTQEVIREVAEATRLAKGVDARLEAARAALAKLPETPPPGTNSISLRAQRTRRASVVSKFEQEAAALQDRIENAVVARAKGLLQSDEGLKAKYQKAQDTLAKAQEGAQAARRVRDEALAKAKSAPVLASPGEVKAARRLIQDRIDGLMSGDMKTTRDALAKVNKDIAEKQKVVDNVYAKFNKEIGDDAAKKALLEAVQKEKVAKAEKAAAEATRILREETARVDRVIREADEALIGTEARATALAAKSAALTKAAEDTAAAQDVALRARAEVTRFLDQIKAARESSESAAREAAIGGARVGAARRAANAEVGQKDPDQTLMRLGMSVTRGVQFAQENISGEEMAGIAEDVARRALESSDSFEEMYSKIIGLWVAKYGALGAVLGQDAKSMAFAAAAMIEGASRDLAIEGTLREGIGMVDPAAAKAMERINRISLGNMRAADLTSRDIQAALLGFAKIGQIWNRTVEGKGVKTAVAGGAEKSDRDLGVFLASVRDVKVDNQTIYLPRALSEALSSEMDLMRKEIDALPTQNPNTLMNMWLVDTTRDLMRFVRTSRLVGYMINPLGYRAKTLAGDAEQIYYAIGGKEALQTLALAPLQMVPFKGAVAVDAAHSGAGKLEGAVKAGLNAAAVSGLPEKVKSVIARVGNPLADLIRGTFNADIGKVISSVATDPRQKFTFGGVEKTRAAWIEEAARQGAFDTNVEAGMRKSVRDVRSMITEVTSRRMTWADAVEAGKERGESPFKLYMLRQRVPLKEDDITSKPGYVSRLSAGAVEHQRALEAREADVQRTTRQALYFRLREQGLTENEAGEVMRRGLLDWSHGLNRSVAGVLAYMPFWRYHTLSFKQGFEMLLGGGGRFDRYAKTLRAYSGLYEGTPEEEEIALIKERARAVARDSGRSEEAADTEVSTFLAARQFAIGAVPRFLRDSGQAYSVEHVSGVNFSDLGSGAWQRETDKVEQARRDHRDPGNRTTSWKANAVLRSSAVGSIDAIATMSLMMEAAYHAADGDMVASEGALLKAGTPWIGRMPDMLGRKVEDAILSISPVANAAYGGKRAYPDYGRLTPAEADLAEMIGVPLTSTPEDPRPQAPWWFKWMVSLPVVEVPVPVVGQVRDAYKAATYSNSEMYGDSTFKRIAHTPLAMWGVMRSYDFDPIYNRSLENAALNRAAQEVEKQAEQGTQLYRTR